jgi:hypothetical protein
MIYIVEIPHQLPPKVWSRSTKEEIMSVIIDCADRSGDTIYEELTGRELLEMFGYDSTTEMREDEELTTLADLIDTHGLTATFYKGYGDDEYRVEPVDKWESCLKWNGHDLNTQMVYMSDEEARAAVADDSEWRHIHQGIEARIALADQLP